MLPSNVSRALQKLGGDLATARRKRRFTVAMMTERAGVSKSTYLKVEKGDPSVSMGTYAMVLFVLGFAERIAEIADARRDDIGLVLDEARLPKRVRPSKKKPSAL